MAIAVDDRGRVVVTNPANYKAPAQKAQEKQAAENKAANAGVNRSAYGSPTAGSMNQGGHSGGASTSTTPKKISEQEKDEQQHLITEAARGNTEAQKQAESRYLTEAVEQQKNEWNQGIGSDKKVWFDFDENNNHVKTTDKNLTLKNYENAVNTLNNAINYLNSNGQTIEGTIQNRYDIQTFQKGIKDGLLDDYEFEMEDGSTKKLSELYSDVDADLDKLVGVVHYRDTYHGLVDYLGGDTDYNTTTKNIRTANLYANNPDYADDADLWTQLGSALEGQLYADNQKRVQANQNEQDSIARQLTNLKGQSLSAADDIAMLGYDLEGSATRKKDELDKQIAELDARQKELQEQQSQMYSEYENFFMTPEVAEAMRLAEMDPLQAFPQAQSIEERDYLHNYYQSIVDEFKQRIGMPTGALNTGDQFLGAAESAFYGIGASAVGVAANVGLNVEASRYSSKQLDEMLAQGIDYTEDTKAAIEQNEQAIAQKRKEVQDYDYYHHQPGLYRERFGNGLKIDEAKARLDELDKREEELSDYAGLDITPDMQKELTDIRDERKQLNKSIEQWEREDEAKGISRNPTVEMLQNSANKLDEKSQEAYRKATQNAGKYKKIFLDVTKTGLEMGFDLAVAAATGTPAASLISMFLRTYGSESTAALNLGADIWDADKFAFTKAGIEMLTEEMFGMFTTFGYGRGLSSDLADALVMKLCDTPAGMAFCRAFLNAAGEGVEEIMSDVLAPFADKIVQDKSLRELYKEDLANVWYDGFLGFIMGSLGALGNVKNNSREVGEWFDKGRALNTIQGFADEAGPAVDEMYRTGEFTEEGVNVLRDLESAQEVLAQNKEFADVMGKKAAAYEEEETTNTLEGMAGYVARHATSKPAQFIANITERAKQMAGKTEAKGVDKGGKIEEGEKAAPAKKVAAKKAKTTKPAVSSETAQGGKATTTGENIATEAEKSVKPTKESVKPASAPIDTTITAELSKSDKLSAENAARQAAKNDARKADNAKIDDAIKRATPVTFDGKAKGQDVKVTYDPTKHLFSVVDSEGNTVFEKLNVNKKSAKHLLNQYRSPDQQAKTAPAPAPEAAPAPVQGEESEAAKRIREIAQTSTLPKLRLEYFNDPDAFAAAYQEITGEELSRQDPAGDVVRLYRQMQGIEEEVEAEEESASEPVAEQEVEAPAEEVAEAETQPVEAEPAPEPAAESEPESQPEAEAVTEPTPAEETAPVEKPVKEKPAKQKKEPKPSPDSINYDTISDDIKAGRLTPAQLTVALNDPRTDLNAIRSLVGLRDVASNTKTKGNIRGTVAAYRANVLKDAEAIAKRAGQKAKADARNAVAKQERAEDRAETQEQAWTPEHRAKFSQHMIDLIQNGNRSAEDLSQMLRKSDLGDFSEELIQLAKENHVNVEPLYDALVNGYEYLTHDDISVYGDKVRPKYIQEAIDQHRGKSNVQIPVPKIALAETATTRTEAEQNVANERSERNAGRVLQKDGNLGSEDGPIYGFLNSRGNRQDVGRNDVARTAAVLSAKIEEADKRGAKTLAYEALSPATRRVVDALLDGVDGDPNSQIPFVTVFDCSDMTPEDFDGVYGEVLSDDPDAGIFLFVNTPRKSNRIAANTVILHEPVHWAFGKWLKQNPDKKAYNYINFLASAVQKYYKGNGVTLSSDPKIAKNTILNGVKLLVEKELSFSGKGVLVNDYYIDYLKDEDWAMWDLANYDEKLQMAKEWIDDDADFKEFKNTIFEEAIGNYVSGNKALNNGNINAEEFMPYFRETMYEQGLMPRGYFENLDKPAKAWAQEQGKKPSKKLRVEEAKKPKKWHIDLIAPEGAKNIRTNKDVKTLKTYGEQSEMGNVSYKSVSVSEMARAAKANIDKYSYDQIYSFLSHTPAGHADALMKEIAVQLYARLDLEARFRQNNGGKVGDPYLPSDLDVLIKNAGDLAKWVYNATGEAARIMVQRATLTPELKVLTNGAHQFIDDAVPGELDPDSIGAKMYKIIDDNVRYLQDIDRRRGLKEDDAEYLSEEEATKMVADQLREVNRTRDVNKIFGKAGKLMTAWEERCINKILSEPNAYETLKMMTLGSINRISSDFQTVGAVNTIKQIRYLNLLSNTATAVNNILNNLESSTTQAFSQNLAAKLTNKRAQKIRGDQTLAKDYSVHHLFGSKNKELNNYMLLKGAESVLSLYYGLDVDEGAIDIDLGAKHNQNDGTAGRLLSRFQFLSGLKMTTSDAMAIARAYKGMEMGIDELNVSDERKAELKRDAFARARERMYHGETKLAKAMNSLRDAANQIVLVDRGNQGKIGLGDVMMPFVQVPTNVAARAMRASPVGILYGIGKYYRGMAALEKRAETYKRVEQLQQQREAGQKLSDEDLQFLTENKNAKLPTDDEIRRLQLTLGESYTNLGATVLGCALAMLGALRDFDDEDDENMRRLAKERGYTGLQLNLSAIANNGKWNDKGDAVIGGSWLEVMAIPLAIGYHIFKSYHDETNGTAELFKTIAMSPISTLNTLVDAAEEIPGIKQAAEIWEAYENLQQYDNLSEGISKLGAGLTQYAANTAASFVIPNLATQFGTGLDNTVRDVYNADTTLEVAKNIIQNKVPWWRSQLPEMKSTLGETRTYGANKAMGVLNRMILPGTGVQVWRRSDLEVYYDQLSQQLKKEGKKNLNVAAKNSAPNYIKADNQEFYLNAEEKRKFDQHYSEEVAAIHNIMIKDKNFQTLSAEAQQDALQDARTLINHKWEEYTLQNMEGCDANVDFKNWERTYINDMKGAANYLTARYGAKQFYKGDDIIDHEGLDKYLREDYSKLDSTTKALLDASYPRLDSMYDAYTKTGMTSERYDEIKALWKKYDDIVNDKKQKGDETYSSLNRDLLVDIYDMDMPEAQKDWAAENFKLWMTIPANVDTPEKIVNNTSLSWREADQWLDVKSKAPIPDGYSKLPKNAIYMLIRDSSFSEQKKWELLEQEATDSAWAKLSKFREEGKTLAYALENARWYKPQRFSNYKEMRYDVIYPKDDEDED